MTVLPSTYGELVAQNFPWVTGATGRSWGEGTTVEIDGDVLVVGSFEPAANVQFSATTATPIQPIPFNNPNAMSAYIARYDQNGNPQSSAVILPIAGQPCATNTNESWSVLKQVVVTPGNEIYAIGEFNACSLEFFAPNGSSLGQAASAINANLDRVFVVHYDQTLTYQGCYIFTAQGQCDAIYDGRNQRTSTAADVAVGIEDVNNAIFIGANFCGESIRVEHFGNMNPPAAGLANMPINVGLNKQWQIYLGVLNYNTNTLQSAIEMGLEMDDLVSELTTGYLYAGAHLYMSGTFTDNITFIDNAASTATTYAGFGDFDVFACRFDNMDILQQSGVVAGGPDRDQALALSDDGQMIGGFVSDGAFFNGVNTTINLNPTAALPGGGLIRQEGFIAIPDYDNNDWEWATQIVNDIPANNCFTSQVNELAGSCEEVYVAWNRGMHDEVLDLPEYHLLSAHMPEPAAPNTSLHSAYTRLEKWHHLGTSATQIWEYDLINGSPVLMTCGGSQFNHNTQHRKTKMVRDIEVRSETYFDGPEDVMMTGWFGTELRIPNNPPWVTNPFYNGGGPGVHDENGMFLLSMDEEPEILIDEPTLCITDDPYAISVDFIPSVLNGANWNLPSPNYAFSGAGIIDPVNGVFSAGIAGIGQHTITLQYEYFGCLREAVVAIIEVAEEPYPRQPFSGTNATDMAEGLAAEGASYSQLINAGGQPTGPDKPHEYEYNYLAGRYFGVIEFEREDGTMISFNSGVTEAGYIVAYGPCGAVWAINIESSTGDNYIEDLKVAIDINGGVPGDPNGSVDRLFAVGAVHPNLVLTHSEGLTMPTQAINPMSNQLDLASGAPNPFTAEKGILMEIDIVTGEIHELYLGGDNPSESNRFHSISIRDDFFAIAGECTGDFTYADLGPTASVGTDYDPFVLLGDIITEITDMNLTVDVGTVFGTGDDDHGDAVDLQWKSSVLEIVLGGHLEPGVISSSFTTVINGGVIPTGNGSEVYLANYDWDPTLNVVNHKILKRYAGVGNDYLRDVALSDFSQGAIFQGNQVFFCGQFSGDFTHDFGTMSTGGTNDFDAYIGSSDVLFTDNWFTHEGRSATFSDEAANSLTIRDNQVYAYGMMDGMNGVSDFWNAVSTPTSPSMLDGWGNAGFHDIFTLSFQPDGTLINEEFALPFAPGGNSGEDIENTDNELVSAGILKITVGSSINFIDGASQVHHTLFQVNSVSDAFIGRIGSSGLGYYKSDNSIEGMLLNHISTVTAYPNPNDGFVEIKSPVELNGTISVHDVSGRMMDSFTLIKQSSYGIMMPYASGIYSIRINCIEYSGVVKVVVH